MKKSLLNLWPRRWQIIRIFAMYPLSMIYPLRLILENRGSNILWLLWLAATLIMIIVTLAFPVKDIMNWKTEFVPRYLVPIEEEDYYECKYVAERAGISCRFERIPAREVRAAGYFGVNYFSVGFIDEEDFILFKMSRPSKPETEPLEQIRRGLQTMSFHVTEHLSIMKGFKKLAKW